MFAEKNGMIKFASIKIKMKINQIMRPLQNLNKLDLSKKLLSFFVKVNF
jgi:hypothetical protein